MQIDPNLFPTTLDALHLGLAGLAALLLILLVIVLTISVAALLRRGKTEPLSVIIERVPAEMASPARTEPLQVVIERVPAAMIPPAAPAPAPKAPEAPKPEPVIVKEATPEAALQLLGLLQKEARFLEFVQEEVAGYSDADIGAASRVVHEGCRRVLRQHFELEPVRKEEEGQRITLPKGFDPSAVRPVGNIVGQPPFTGTLVHRGWRASQVKLPKIAEGHNVNIIAPAEVEL